MGIDIFIDLDGPLLDGMNRHYHCYKTILLEEGDCAINLLPSYEYWNLKRAKTEISEILAKSGYHRPVSHFHQRWLDEIESREALALDMLKPGARETLQAWKGEHRLFLATCRQSEQRLWEQLEQLDIKRFFTGIFCCGIEKREHVKYQALKNVERGVSIFIGDTEADMESARLLNMTRVAITTGLRRRELLEADYYFEEICDIPQALLQ